VKIFQVDSFTDKPFKGNPAGVCLLEDERTKTWMQSIAMEMNLSETAFVLRRGNGFKLQWFTPATEVSMCGHATLASAHILWESEILDEEQLARFDTKSGELVCKKTDEWIEMAFPSREVRTTQMSESLTDALNLAGKEVTASVYDTDEGLLYLVEVASDAIVKRVTPHFTKLRDVAATAIVTSRSSSHEFDFVSRFFAPSLGIDEDPVTGSAHCYLAPYWSRRLDKSELVGYQSSKRGGIVRCKLSGEKVLIGGKAVTVFEAELVGC
jgi:PhzF family phenazine biosynthesis protein